MSVHLWLLIFRSVREVPFKQRLRNSHLDRILSHCLAFATLTISDAFTTFGTMIQKNLSLL